MASPARPLASCVLRWIYEQIAEVLQKLKDGLLSLISLIDAQIAILRAWLAQWDLLAKGEEFLWNQAQKVIDEIREALTTMPDGPLAEFCPEFYEYFMEPGLAIFEAAVAGLTLFRNRFHDMISYMDDIDRLIAYWEQIKVDLLAAIEVIDDAIFIQTMAAAEKVP